MFFDVKSSINKKPSLGNSDDPLIIELVQWQKLAVGCYQEAPVMSHVKVPLALFKCFKIGPKE